MMSVDMLWNETQRHFYNSRDHRRMWFAQNSFFVKNILEGFISFTRLDPTWRILELGCGAGRYTIPLVQRGFNIMALDISERMLSKFKKDAEGLHLSTHQYQLICGDLNSLSINNKNRFDAIIGFNVLHHLYDVQVSLQKTSTYLREGGVIAFLEPHAINFLHCVDTILDRGWKAEGNKFKSLPENIRTAMDKNNFKNIEYKRFGFFPPFFIDHFPILLKYEHSIEEKKCFDRILPYFMIKGIKS